MLILLSLLVCGMLVGYAALSDNLFIEGDAEIQGKPFEGVYITDVSVYSTNRAESVSFAFISPPTSPQPPGRQP